VVVNEDRGQKLRNREMRKCASRRRHSDRLTTAFLGVPAASHQSVLDIHTLKEVNGLVPEATSAAT